MYYENVYTSIACNRSPESADWGYEGLIVFGANNSVALCDPQFNRKSAKILKTFVGHRARVNTVRWLKRICEKNTADHSIPTKIFSQSSLFVSGSDDGTAMLWKLTDTAKKEVVCGRLQSHSGPVHTVDGLEWSKNNDCLLATSGSDSMLKLWYYSVQRDHLSELNSLSSNELTNITCLQTIDLNNSLCLTLELTWLPKSQQILLALGLDDGNIVLWTNSPSSFPSSNSLANDLDKESLKFTFVYKLVTGHEDWIRGLDFIHELNDNNNLMMATCAQDNYIRLWNIQLRSATEVEANSNQIYNYIDINDTNSSVIELKMEEKIIKTSTDTWYAITLDSVLYGHDAWVYSVHWNREVDGVLRLLSVSIDKTMVVWESNDLDAENGSSVWMEKVRLGDVGGNAMGFYGGRFSPDGNSIMGHSCQGSFHIWRRENVPDGQDIWKPRISVGGHFGEVRDLAWAPKGEYLITVSSDQTTRIHAPWIKGTSDEGKINLLDDKCTYLGSLAENETTWHEISRPQVHGYDMQTIAMLSRYKFASGAEEKIVRTFQAPSNFIDNFQQITQAKDSSRINNELGLNLLPKGASVPSLGLSNKAIYQSSTSSGDSTKADDINLPLFDSPPQEETLMENTLWPEVQKLYGHGYEIYALAATNEGRLLASACRSTRPEFAKVILWNTETWKQHQQLPGHQLTVTQMRFSSNNRYLLTVSRDRCWCLYKADLQQNIDDASDAAGNALNALPIYELVAKSDKSNGIHTRIIWSCDWSFDSKYFVTSSREGKVVVWTKDDNEESAPKEIWKSCIEETLKGQSVTAVAFYQESKASQSQTAYPLAMGCESGLIYVYQFQNKTELKLMITMDSLLAHHLAVRRLQFRPRNESVDTTQMNKMRYELASCGNDGLVRIHRFQLD